MCGAARGYRDNWHRPSIDPELRVEMPVTVLRFLIVLSTLTHLTAEEVLPAGVEDPFGLGPRLALIDHLKEQHGITMPPGPPGTMC